jgi:hypothetical protein
LYQEKPVILDLEILDPYQAPRIKLEVLEKREMFLHDSKNAILKARQDGAFITSD